MARRGPRLLPWEGTARGQQEDSVAVLPAIPLYSKLMPLRTVVSMLGGNTFHHLYSSPSTGSVPAGQLRQPGDRRGQPCTRVPPTYPCQPLQVPQSPLGDNDGDTLMGPVRTRGDTPAPISPPASPGAPVTPWGQGHLYRSRWSRSRRGRAGSHCRCSWRSQGCREGRGSSPRMGAAWPPAEAPRCRFLALPT